MIAQYHLDIAFIGTDGFTVTEGCTTHDEMEAHTDLGFIGQAARTVVIADSTKIGKVTFARICGTDVIDTLVTDPEIDARGAHGDRGRRRRGDPRRRGVARWSVSSCGRHAVVTRSRARSARPVSASKT